MTKKDTEVINNIVKLIELQDSVMKALNTEINILYQRIDFIDTKLTKRIRILERNQIIILLCVFALSVVLLII